MRNSRLTLLAVLASSAALAGAGISQDSPSGRPWPAPVAPAAAEAPPLEPAAALQTFTMPPGYHLELVASEPLVQDPIVIDWDVDGRLWVVEMPGFVPELAAAEPDLDPIGRVVVLEDTDHDGRMDKRTIFADDLVLARAVKALEHGVLVGEPPNVWLMHDTDGDLRADARDLVTDRYGRREGRVEQNANQFHWGLDNRIDTANSDIYLRFTNGRFEVHGSLSRGEWGVTHDDGGRVYRNTNESVLHVDIVPTPYYARHPTLLRTRGSYEALDGDDDAANVVWPAHATPGTNRAYQAGILRADGSLAHFTSVSAPVVYRGDRLPAELYGNVFVAEPAANLVSRILIEDAGTSFHARKAYARGEFLTSTDERFRPVYLSNAPDGTLYIVDMYRGVIQQRADVTEYLRDHIRSRRLEHPTGRGRIYRVVHETTVRDAPPPRAGATAAELVALLSHPNGWWRDSAEQRLVERGDPSVAPALARPKLAAARGQGRERRQLAVQPQRRTGRSPRRRRARTRRAAPSGRGSPPRSSVRRSAQSGRRPSTANRRPAFTCCARTAQAAAIRKEAREIRGVGLPKSARQPRPSSNHTSVA